MCVTVAVKKGANTFCDADTKRGLADVLGIEPVQIGEYTKWDDGDCLCPCDIEKTAEAAGYSVSPGWDTAGCDWLMTSNA